MFCNFVITKLHIQMANPLKQLAGETAIYGLSTILARVINFLLVPMYTRMLSTQQYGIFTEFMSYIAVLQVVLVLGLETGCFRFANKEGENAKNVFTTAFNTVLILNIAFLALITVFSGQITSFLGYEGYRNVIIYMAGILVLDNSTAILFSKLRQERKSIKFVIIKSAKILTEMAVNIFLFTAFTQQFQSTHAGAFLLHFVSPTPDFSYPIFSVFASSILCAIMFIPDLFRLNYTFDKQLFKKVLAYSLPLMIAALPGCINEFVDRLLFRYYDTSADVWQSSLGIFQASVKLAVIMNLFIQMFRYAAEPFFFQRSKEKGSIALYAKVMDYFTAFCGLIFLGVILYIDILSLILGQNFRSGIGVVPIMLLSYMILGMLFNVNMWYKLSEKTNLAIWITLAGLIVTIIINILFMPRYSYWAAAFGHLASYIIMFIISAALGAKYYPIPYRWGRLTLIFLAMGLIYALTLITDKLLFNGGVQIGITSTGTVLAELSLHTLYLLLYLALCYLILKNYASTQSR